MRKKNFRGLPSSQPIHQPFMGNSSVASAPTTMHWRPFLAHQRCIVPDWLGSRPRGIVRYIYTRLFHSPRQNKAIDEKIASMPPARRRKKRSHARKPILTLLPFDNWTNGSSFDEGASERIALSLSRSYFLDNTGRLIKITFLHSFKWQFFIKV